MSKELETLEALTGLKQLINGPDKFVKHHLYEERGEIMAYCVVGGIRKLCSGSPVAPLPRKEWAGVENTIAKVARAMRITPKQHACPPSRGRAQIYNLWWALVNFNNAPETTYEKLTARIDKAIRRVQSRYGHK